MKKLFALLAVVALAAVGCDDKKTTAKPVGGGGTGGTFERKDTVRVDVNATQTNTVLLHTATETRTNTVGVTVTKEVKPKGDGPAVPPAGGGVDKDKKPGDR